ncbi:hypothetical protein PAHAL_7G005500 [Panicum hallii]|uniref:Uncharacterized protein n=1 Tax=Panicum hallii TaxID=206008 RepID=A0A2S3I503_9POAL|nr:uncharacterized protein LOC112899477 isoform X2 [Panicum hallii]PAN36858.1 hypothetical protein PAHAL_7G005500 [Panicum hallii]
MSSSPEMRVLHLRIHKGLLYCTYCRGPLRPNDCMRKPWMCAGGHIFCRECTSCHENACISGCLLMDGIMAQMKIECNFCHSGNIPYSSFFAHLCDHPPDPKLRDRQIESVFCPGECTLDANLLGCSECKLPLRPPIYKHLSRDSPVCGACYRGDIDNYLHCRELDYLVQGITAKCVACEEYLPFSTLALHQLDDCPFKHKLQKIAPGSSAQKNLCDEYGSTRSSACNSTNIGKSKGKAPPRVRKMDNHIVDSNVDESDDDSSDDIHPETGKRVAETVLKTSAYNKKAKIATPSGEKMGAHPANN